MREKRDGKRTIMAMADTEDPKLTKRKKISPSCCSTIGLTTSSGLTNEIMQITNPEDENSTFDSDTHRSDIITPSSRKEKMEGTSKVATETKNVAREKMPSQEELDEFFSAAEKKIQKIFADKYNFDVVNEQPLEGRYEWVEIKP